MEGRKEERKDRYREGRKDRWRVAWNELRMEGRKEGKKEAWKEGKAWKKLQSDSEGTLK